MIYTYTFSFINSILIFDSYGSFAYKYILSMSGWFSIKFNNKFVSPDPEPLIINILYG